jgi:hypothetical protein
LSHSTAQTAEENAVKGVPTDTSTLREAVTRQFYGTTSDTTFEWRNKYYPGYATFGLSKFKWSFRLDSVKFDSFADFSKDVFDSAAGFSGLQFGTRASFQNSQFYGPVYFSGNILPDTLDFRFVRQIANEIDFTDWRPPLSGKKCLLALNGTILSKIRLNMNLFSLWFPDSVTIDEKESVYQGVLKKLKDDGFLDSFEKLDIEFREFQYDNSNWFDRNIVASIQRVWSNYGYNKELIFLWSVGFLILFSGVNLRLFPNLYTIYPIPAVGHLGPQELIGRRWVYVLQTVVYTVIVFFGLKLDLGRVKSDTVWQHPILFIYLFVIYVSGLICLGFIANLILAH